MQGRFAARRGFAFLWSLANLGDLFLIFVLLLLMLKGLELNLSVERRETKAAAAWPQLGGAPRQDFWGKSKSKSKTKSKSAASQRHRGGTPAGKPADDSQLAKSFSSTMR